MDLALRTRCLEVDLAELLDQLVVEPREVRRLEVRVDPTLPQGIDQRLDHAVGHGSEQIGDRLGYRAECSDQTVAPLERTAGRGDECRNLLAVPLRRDHRQWRI